MKRTAFILLSVFSLILPLKASFAKDEAKAVKPPVAAKKEAPAPVKKEATPEIEREPAYIPNENDIKSFVYRWFSWLDHQVPDFLFIYHISKDDLVMKLPDATLRSVDDFKKWYQSQKERIKSNSYEVGEIKVSFLPKERFKVEFPVRWRAKTHKGESLEVKYKEIWILSLAGSGRLNINRYTVRKAK